MPLYEYECRTCGTTFEKRQHFGESPLAHCPHGHADVRRIYSPAGVIFKGSGWYITDSRKLPAETTPRESKGEDKK